MRSGRRSACLGKVRWICCARCSTPGWSRRSAARKPGATGCESHERSRNPSRAHRSRAEGGGLGRRRGQPHPARVSDHTGPHRRPRPARQGADRRLRAGLSQHQAGGRRGQGVGQATDRRRGAGEGLRRQAGRSASPTPPTARASTASTCRPARKASCRAIPTPDELWDADLRRSERVARPLRRRAVRGQGRLAPEPLLPGHRRRAGDGGHRRRTGSASCSRSPPARARPSSRSRSRGSCSTAAGTSSREPSRRPRILFLADRNILANQAYNAFSAFPEDALVRIAPDDIRKKGKVPKNGSLFFTIFQTFMSGPPKDGQPSPYFGEYPPDFFDFIVIDECHRGGANDESNWRGILEYFAPAVQLGLTATPKRKDNVDTYAYFGEPVYIYSLKEGINDGFLTPFKVKQISTTLDEYVYTPDDKLIEGEIESGKRYTEADFNKIIEIKEREAHRVKIFMDADQPAREDAGVLRHPGSRAGRARPHQPDEDEQGPELLPARHRQRRRARRAAPARLPGQREDDPDDPDHLAEALDRRGRPQHPQHRADAPDQLDDRVQADHRPRHAALRRQGLLHDLRLREGASPLQRSGMGRRTDRTRARRSRGSEPTRSRVRCGTVAPTSRERPRPTSRRRSR